VSNANASIRKLNSLLKSLPAASPRALPDADNVLAVLVQSFLLWESTTDKALAAYQKVLDHVVDFNDLRVCMPHETAEVLGARYPRAQDRCERLRATLRDIYLREHAVDLSSLTGMGKRDVKKYIESLDGVTTYVAGRVQLLCYQVHSIPVDEQLRAALIAEGAADESQNVADLAGWLARQIKSEEGLRAHQAFQAWIDRGPGKLPRRRSTTKKKTSRKPARSPG
jgi:hypothetical protein